MANPNSPATDGDWTIPQQDGRRKESFPFDFLGDGYAKLIERKYRMLGTSYTGPATVNRTTYQNLLTYSDDYSQAQWTKNGVTVVSNAIANPWDGTVGVDEILETATTVIHGLSRTATPPAIGTATLWAIVKGGVGRDWVWLRSEDTVDCTAFFNLTTGAKGTATNCVSYITPLASGFYYIAMVFVAGPSFVGPWVLSSTADNNTSAFLGDVSKGFYCAQAQLVLGGNPGPLIITGASAVGTVTVPNTDAGDNAAKNGDPFAFLLTETPPADADLELGLIAFTRKYGRIPATEVEYTSRFVQRPVMDGAYIAPTYYTASVDDGVTSHIFNTRTSVVQTGTIAADPNIVSIVVNSHNFNVGDEAVLWWGNGIVARTPILGTAASFFYVAADSVSVPSAACNFVQVTKNAMARYVNGNKNCSIKRSHYFYLPGYTVAGTIAVTTGADIPNFDVYTDPTAWLGRIVPTVSAATYSAIEVSAISYYQGNPGSPVLTQMVDEAQMSDALDTIPV